MISASSSECICCNPAHVKRLQNPGATLKQVLNDPDHVVVIAIRWFKPGKTDAWKETYVTSLQHALIDYGEALHEDQVGIFVESAERDGEAHQMANNNARVFANRLQAAKLNTAPATAPVPAPAPAPAPAPVPAPAPAAARAGQNLVIRIPPGAFAHGHGVAAPIKKRGRPTKVVSA